MAKQTIFLVFRALVIGVLLNLGIQYVADTEMSQQQTSTQPVQPALQTSNN